MKERAAGCSSPVPGGSDHTLCSDDPPGRLAIGQSHVMLSRPQPSVGYREMDLEQLEARFAVWADRRPDIRAAIVLGSRARTDHPADEWSDLDLLIIATAPERYLSRTDWLQHIGTPWITFVEPTATGGGRERRVLFEGGLDVDFSVFSKRQFQVLLYVARARQRLRYVAHLFPKGLSARTAQVAADLGPVVRRGYRVLLDKDGLFDQLLRTFAGGNVRPPLPPGQAEFQEVVSDFWYHAVWTARKLQRGELWVAKSCCDGYMKRQMLQMIEWHARAARCWTYDTWHGGRFLEEWADPRAVQALHDVFAHYDEEDVRRALFETMSVFRWLAIETAGRSGYSYPSVADERATELVATLLRQGAV